MQRDTLRDREAVSRIPYLLYRRERRAPSLFLSGENNLSNHSFPFPQGKPQSRNSYFVKPTLLLLLLYPLPAGREERVHPILFIRFCMNHTHTQHTPTPTLHTWWQGTKTCIACAAHAAEWMQCISGMWGRESGSTCFKFFFKKIKFYLFGLVWWNYSIWQNWDFLTSKLNWFMVYISKWRGAS